MGFFFVLSLLRGGKKDSAVGRDMMKLIYGRRYSLFQKFLLERGKDEEKAEKRERESGH